MDTLKSAVNSVINAITPAVEGSPSLSRAQVVALEEQERQRRVEHASQSHLDQQNARKVATIIQGLHFPVLKSSNNGFKRYTRRSEEYERQRRMENRVEFEMRKLNALKMSGFITSLGWPFTRLQQGPEYIYPDETAQQEEQERRYRLNNPMLGKLAKQNAANVAGIARWAHFKKNPLAGSKRRTRALEEKERKRRLLNTQELEQSCANCYAVSRCIRSLGHPFYVQGKESRTASNQLSNLEEKERTRRIHDKTEQALAREQASKISGMLPSDKNVLDLEDKERDRRLLDFQGQQMAKDNASKVSSLFFASNIDAVEKRERERRLNALDEQALAKQTASKVSKLISSNQRDTKYASLDNAETLEREYRLASPMEQMAARQNASQISKLVSQAGFQKGSSFTKLRGPSVVGVRKAIDIENLEAQERSRRLADLQEQEVARSNAHNVAMLLQEQAQPSVSNTLDIENAERERRVIDSQGQQTARNNAQKISGLVRDAYWQDSQKSLAASDIELGYSYVQPAAGSALPSKDRNLGLGQSPYGTSNQSSYAMPNQSAYLPSPTQVTTTYIPSSATPLTSYVAPTQFATVPTVTRGLATVHTERERKVLSKAAAKHAKLATKESRKAEQKAHKAEQLHIKGKDTRAAKYEANAEQHALAAKHHQQWSNEAKLMASAANDPSLITTTSTPARPAM